MVVDDALFEVMADAFIFIFEELFRYQDLYTTLYYRQCSSIRHFISYHIWFYYSFSLSLPFYIEMLKI
jgi:hypothetical protein